MRLLTGSILTFLSASTMPSTMAEPSVIILSRFAVLSSITRCQEPYSLACSVMPPFTTTISSKRMVVTLTVLSTLPTTVTMASLSTASNKIQVKAGRFLSRLVTNTRSIGELASTLKRCKLACPKNGSPLTRASILYTTSLMFGHKSTSTAKTALVPGLGWQMIRLRRLNSMLTNGRLDNT